MSRPLRYALLAVACVLLLSGSGYYAWRQGRGGATRPHLPLQPGVQVRPDLSARFLRLREAIAQGDHAGRTAVLVEISRFKDAAVPPLKEEAERITGKAEEGLFLAALIEALGRIGTRDAEATVLAVVQEAAQNRVPPQTVLAAFEGFPERSRPIALRAVLVEVRVSPDEAVAQSYSASLPRYAKPADTPTLRGALATMPEQRRDALARCIAELEWQARADALVQLDSIEDAERLLFGPYAVAPSTRPLAAQGAEVLQEATASARSKAPSEAERLAAVRFLEGSSAKTPSAEAAGALERAVASTPPAIDALARLAGRGDGQALDALKRIYAGGVTSRTDLVAHLAIYATQETAALLAEWSADPSQPKDIAARARQCADVLRRSPR